MPGGGPGGAAGAAAEPNPRPYATVIRGDVKTKTGLFKTHRIGGRLYYEIPKGELGKDMLMVTQIARTAEGSGYGGQALDNRVVRWERKDNRVFLRSVNFAIIADPSSSVAKAVEAANYDVILGAFNVETYGPDSAAVIEVSRLFTAPPTELSLLRRYRGTLDASRSFFERVATFPTNIETEATLTLNATPTPTASPFGGGGGAAAPGAPPQSKTYLVHWSMVKLPDKPMMPRLCDSRVGYFRTTSLDYSRPEQRAQDRCFIARYRLEKTDPAAAVSEPVKPIVFYVDPATPEWLKPVGAQGHRELAAVVRGRRIQERHHRQVRTVGGRGSRLVARGCALLRDPLAAVDDRERVGSAHLRSAHGRDHRGRHPDLPQRDEPQPRLVLDPGRGARPAREEAALPRFAAGRLMEYVIAHEIGHSLGFAHNMKASSLYPVDSIRSKDICRQDGAHADADGLLALQLRGAARGWHRPG